MTHNKLTILVVYISLQQCLTWALGEAEARTLRTNLIFQHGVPDIFDQATKFVQTFNLAFFCKFLQFSGNFFQFPNNKRLSNLAFDLENTRLPLQNLSPRFLPFVTLGNG